MCIMPACVRASVSVRVRAHFEHCCLSSTHLYQDALLRSRCQGRQHNLLIITRDARGRPQLFQSHRLPPISTKVPNQNLKSLLVRPTNANKITQIINSFQPNKSSGYDNFNPYLLKLIGEELSIPIAALINKSISEGTFLGK